MTIIQAIILGSIQGLSEFIPISSSGHLQIASELFAIPSSFEIETLLNIGTLLAAVIYFRKDILAALNPNNNLFKLLVIGSIPLFVGGVLFDLFLKDVLRAPVITVVMLVSVGWLMVISRPGERNTGSLDIKDSAVIGFSQVLALIPGTSRSGITILSAMKRGLSAEAAARFSFLLSIPAVGGAVVYTALDMFINGELTETSTTVLIAGNIAAFITSLLAIHGMISFLKKYGLQAFGWYRIGLGVILLAVIII